MKLGILTEGDHFRFESDPSDRIRKVQQKGRHESYCPYIGQDTLGHSKYGGEEVYTHSTEGVIPLDNEGNIIPVDFFLKQKEPACDCPDRQSFDNPEADEIEPFYGHTDKAGNEYAFVICNCCDKRVNF